MCGLFDWFELMPRLYDLAALADEVGGSLASLARRSLLRGRDTAPGPVNFTRNGCVPYDQNMPQTSIRTQSYGLSREMRRL